MMSESTETRPEKIDVAAVAPRVLDVLQRRRDGRRDGGPPRPISARALARRFNIRPNGSADSRRRGVRLVIRHLRNQGAQVAAISSSTGGYFLARDAGELLGYAEQRRREGLADMEAAAKVKRSEEAADAAGQLGLFSS